MKRRILSAILPGRAREWLKMSLGQVLAPICHPRVIYRALGSECLPHQPRWVRIRSGAAAGSLLFISPYRHRKLWISEFEPFVGIAIEGFARPGMVVYDVGAHVGYYSAAFANRVGPSGAVFAFEAHPKNIDALQRMVKRNRYSWVKVVAVALADRAGEYDFVLHKNDDSQGKLSFLDRQEFFYHASIRVPVQTIDDFVGRGLPAADIIKIDVEGAEANVLRGSTNLLRAKKPIVIVELHSLSAAHECLTILGQAHYTITCLDKEGRRTISARDLYTMGGGGGTVRRILCVC